MFLRDSRRDGSLNPFMARFPLKSSLTWARGKFSSLNSFSLPIAMMRGFILDLDRVFINETISEGG